MLNETETVNRFLNLQNTAKGQGLFLQTLSTSEPCPMFCIGRFEHPNHTEWSFRTNFMTLDEVDAFIEGWARAKGDHGCP